MTRIIKKAVMKRAHEMKRGTLSMRLTIAWAEIKSAIQSQARMEAIADLRKSVEWAGKDAMGRAMLEMELLDRKFREQTATGRAL